MTLHAVACPPLDTRWLWTLKDAIAVRLTALVSCLSCGEAEREE